MPGLPLNLGLVMLQSLPASMKILVLSQKVGNLFDVYFNASKRVFPSCSVPCIIMGKCFICYV